MAVLPGEKKWLGFVAPRGNPAYKSGLEAAIRRDACRGGQVTESDTLAALPAEP